MLRKLLMLTIATAAPMAAAVLGGFGPQLTLGLAWAKSTSGTRPAAAAPAPAAPKPAWDGIVRLDLEAITAIDLATAPAAAQVEPWDLELLGTTGYDNARLVKVRPRFDTLVQKVHVQNGQTVRKGDPLVELFSNQLAEAKNLYKIKYLEWVLARRLYDGRKPLASTGAISRVLWVETQNSENKARLDRDLAANTLAIYGLAPGEITPLVEGLDAEEDMTRGLGRIDVAELSRMTLRAPVDGIIIDRDVVPQNLYDESSVLLTIAPLDHLYVWGNVYERDIDRVTVGQDWEIQFPYLGETVQTKVEYVSNRVDPVTHAMRVRASIPNVRGKYKADMLVRALLKIAPNPGDTVVPRQSVLALGDASYVFVQQPGAQGRYERRPVRIAQERSDRVLIAEGLEPGEEVVTAGSLILAQVYEDQSMQATGMPH